MIVVTVQLDSANGEEHDKQLFTMIIGNDGSGTPRFGNYNVFLGRRTSRDPMQIVRNPLRRGRVEHHARRSTHVGTLIRRALEAVDL